MIKGVNKKVLEVNNPQSIYFERAVFYLKPNMTCVSEKLLKHEADELIKGISPKTHKYVSFVKLLTGLSFAFLAVTLSLILIATFF